MSAGQITFNDALPVGDWTIWFLANNGYSSLASSDFSVSSPQGITTDSVTYTVGQPITATFSGGPGNPTDWVGIYPQGIVPDGNPVSTAWYYVNGSKTAGQGVSDGQVVFNEILAEGAWTVWFLANDGYTVINSSDFTVVGSGSAGIVVGPYLQSATSDSMVIMWETTTGTESRVDFGTTTALGTTVSGGTQPGNAGSQIHTVELTGLTADTYYHYQVTTGGASSDLHSFRTMPTDRDADTNFVVYSDMQEQGGAATNIHGRIVNESIPHHVHQWTGESDMSNALDFVLVPGDLVDSGPTYTDWKSQFFDEAKPLIQKVPYFTALGNHEQNHDNYYKYMHNPGNGTAAGDEQWYAFDHGNIKVITLNSNNGDGNQLSWLEDILAEACTDQEIDFVFAQFHHAHISETWLEGQSNIAANFVSRLIDFSKECNKASVHFYGHNHSYQRGQTRDHSHFYMDVSGAEGDLAYWGEYNQANSDIIQKAIVEWGWSFVEVEGGEDPKFVMRRIGLGGENQDYTVNFPGAEIDTVTFRPGSAAPVAPIATAPNGSLVAPENVVLEASPFHPMEVGNSHLASHFQVTTTAGNYENPVEEQWFRWEDRYFKINQNQGVDLTKTKDQFDLEPGTTYFWRVRYRDSGFKWSPWSAEASFTTAPGVCLARNEHCSSDEECCSNRCRANGSCR
ncbi:fibronectin type III domain-containing protein [Microbulbifer pacificus]|uniref:fibronectin type III domain-containing protein n=1 Tax=Microbulbifer pacificus TaxID=407164 RepID=UPI00131A06A8|nr:fibronectin type III domain-containing protein [Microbulbifer pacificus]